MADIDPSQLAEIINSKADNESVVHLTDAESISGIKTFTNKAKFRESVDNNYLQIETATGYNSVNTYNKYDTKLSGLTFGSNEIIFDAETVRAPVVPSDDNSTRIATTAFVNNKIKSGTNYTNCITEIAQDIKLELNDGVLTLKAGSKIYVPNGVNNFTSITTEVDKTLTSAWGTAEDMAVFLEADGSNLFFCGLSRLTSGTGIPTATNVQMWYDLNTNTIKKYDQGAYTGYDYSFPLAIVYHSDSTETSTVSKIKQVFNGFGYIGSTVFTLPGVKGLIPNGRNTDGTLKSIEMLTDKVSIITYTQSAPDCYVCIDLNKNVALNSARIYNEAENNLYNLENLVKVCEIGHCGYTTGNISEWNPKTPFHMIDYSEADFVISYQRPTSSNNYNWYRKYKSGWVEQGGNILNSTSIYTLSVPMENNNYYVNVSWDGGKSSTFYPNDFQVRSLTTTTFYTTATRNGSNVQGRCWYVCGFAA